MTLVNMREVKLCSFPLRLVMKLWKRPEKQNSNLISFTPTAIEVSARTGLINVRAMKTKRTLWLWKTGPSYVVRKQIKKLWPNPGLHLCTITNIHFRLLALNEWPEASEGSRAVLFFLGLMWHKGVAGTVHAMFSVFRGKYMDTVKQYEQHGY